MDYTILVNKTNPITAEKLKGFKLIGVKDTEDREFMFLEKKTYKQYLKLKSAVKKSICDIGLYGCYRTFVRAQQLFDAAKSCKGEEYALNSVALPGTSEHHTGLAIDYAIKMDDGKYVLNKDYGEIPEVKKINDLAPKYGFIVRYPEGKKDITGYQSEPFHLRYVGKKLAEYLTKNNLTLEEYYLSKNKKQS